MVIGTCQNLLPVAHAFIYFLLTSPHLTSPYLTLPCSFCFALPYYLNNLLFSAAHLQILFLFSSHFIIIISCAKHSFIVLDHFIFFHHQRPSYFLGRSSHGCPTLPKALCSFMYARTHPSTHVRISGTPPLMNHHQATVDHGFPEFQSRHVCQESVERPVVLVCKRQCNHSLLLCNIRVVASAQSFLSPPFACLLLH